MRNSKKIFICYSHQDQKWLKWLDPILKPLIREGTVTEWSDRKIDPGKKWKEEIREALRTSGIAILIISQDFLASDFIFENELPPILEAEQEEGLRLLCIYVRPCDIASFPRLLDFQAVNDPQKPLAELAIPARDRVGIVIAENIRQHQTWKTAGDQIEKISKDVPEGTDGLEDDKGFLEYKEDSFEAMTEMNEVMVRIAELTSKVGQKVNVRQESLNSMITKKEDNVKLAISIVNATAMDVNEYSEQLEKEVPILESKAAAMHDNLVPWLRWRREAGHTTDNDSFGSSVLSMIQAVEPSILQMESFRDSMLGMKGASKPLNNAVVRARIILDRLIGTMKKIQTDSKEYLTILN